jgi:hypothetical protein
VSVAELDAADPELELRLPPSASASMNDLEAPAEHGIDLVHVEEAVALVLQVLVERRLAVEGAVAELDAADPESLSFDSVPPSGSASMNDLGALAEHGVDLAHVEGAVLMVQGAGADVRRERRGARCRRSGA